MPTHLPTPLRGCRISIGEPIFPPTNIGGGACSDDKIYLVMCLFTTSISVPGWSRESPVRLFVWNYSNLPLASPTKEFGVGERS